MLYALCVWVISSITAIIIGGIMGYFAGKVELVGQRLIEIWETVPVFMILLLLVSIFSPNLFWLVAISCIFGWMGMSRYVRGEFLRLRNLPFVEFARAQGVSHARIIFIHILPNAITPLVTLAPFVIAGGIYGLSELDYLSQAKANVTVAWWLAVYPSAALFITLLLLTFLGNGLRRAFDPKAHS
jgi:microcin C transport system permease protein